MLPSSRKLVPVEEAVGMVLPHDITEIIKDQFKGRAFKKGHIIRPEDVEHLRRLGKEHIFALQLGPDDIHENEAALCLAQTISGEGSEYSSDIVEGKVAIKASRDGLLKINTKNLLALNMLGEVMCATLHDNTPVRKGEIVAASRLIPLTAPRKLIDQAVALAGEGGPLLRVLPLRQAKVGLIITGNEVWHGRIEDRFEGVLRQKLAALGSEVHSVAFAPDKADIIAEEISKALAAGADLIIASGGMSVDPDDVTRLGICQAGARDVLYGTPVLPGAMFLLAHIQNVPVLGLPACGMYHQTTVMDLVLPRLLTGERITRQDLAMLGHGGLCRNCKECRYPVCGLGKI